jgi:hypothetical protein
VATLVQTQPLARMTERHKLAPSFMRRAGPYVLFLAIVGAVGPAHADADGGADGGFASDADGVDGAAPIDAGVGAPLSSDAGTSQADAALRGDASSSDSDAVGDDAAGDDASSSGSDAAGDDAGAAPVLPDSLNAACSYSGRPAAGGVAWIAVVAALMLGRRSRGRT